MICLISYISAHQAPHRSPPQLSVLQRPPTPTAVPADLPAALLHLPSVPSRAPSNPHPTHCGACLTLNVSCQTFCEAPSTSPWSCRATTTHPRATSRKRATSPESITRPGGPCSSTASPTGQRRSYSRRRHLVTVIPRGRRFLCVDDGHPVRVAAMVTFMARLHSQPVPRVQIALAPASGPSPSAPAPDSGMTNQPLPPTPRPWEPPPPTQCQRPGVRLHHSTGRL